MPPRHTWHAVTTAAATIYALPKPQRFTGARVHRKALATTWKRLTGEESTGNMVTRAVRELEMASLLRRDGDHVVVASLPGLATVARGYDSAAGADRCGCGKESSFDTEREAARTLLRSWERVHVNPNRAECRVYRCESGRWHLTSKPLYGSAHTVVRSELYRS